MAGHASGEVARSADSMVVVGTGVLIQIPDTLGGWSTVAHHYPREAMALSAYDLFGAADVRLVYLDRHVVRLIGAFAEGGAAEGASECPLKQALHSRLGVVERALRSTGGGSVVIVPSDTVVATYAVPAPEVGRIRDWFVVSRGYYVGLGRMSLLSLKRAGLPGRVALTSVAPNPSRAGTVISYELPIATDVSMDVFDASGRRVRTLIRGRSEAGYRQVTWDGRDERAERCRSAMYFVRLNVGREEFTRKVALVE